MDGLLEKILSSNQISPKKFDKILCEVLFQNEQNAIEPYPIEVIPGDSKLQSIVILFKCPRDICEHLVKIQNKISKRKSIIPKEEDITSEEKSNLNLNNKGVEDSNNHADETKTNISYTQDNEQIVSQNDVHTSEKSDEVVADTSEKSDEIVADTVDKSNEMVADTSDKSDKHDIDISHKSVDFEIDETDPDGKTDSIQQEVELQPKVSNKDESKPKPDLKNMPEEPQKDGKKKKGKFAFGKLKKVAKDNTPKIVPRKLSDSTKKGGDNTESSEACNVNKTPTDSGTSKETDELDTQKETQVESGASKAVEDSDKESGKLETEVDKPSKKVSDQHKEIEGKSSNGNTESTKGDQKEKVEILEKNEKESISTEKKEEGLGYAKSTNEEEEEEEEEDSKAQSENVKNKEIEIEENELTSEAVAGGSPDVMESDLENKNSEISPNIEEHPEESIGRKESVKIEKDTNDKNIDDVATQNNGTASHYSDVTSQENHVTPQNNDDTPPNNEVKKEEERAEKIVRYEVNDNERVDRNDEVDRFNDNDDRHNETDNRHNDNDDRHDNKDNRYNEDCERMKENNFGGRFEKSDNVDSKYIPFNEEQRKYIDAGKTSLAKKCRRRQMRKIASQDVEDIDTFEIIRRMREKTRRIVDRQNIMMKHKY